MAVQRGLEFRSIPEIESVSAADLLARARAQIERQTPEPVRDARAQILLRLELVPSDFEWLIGIEGALRGRLQAFYDPDRCRIVIDRALTDGDRERALAHELVHALQDQHHALGARLEYAPDAGDRQAALLALAEGDADALVAELAWPRTSTAGPSWADHSTLDTLAAANPAVPEVLLRSLSAAYVDGLPIVQRVRAAGGWSAVDALYARPTLTTHELLSSSFPGARQAFSTLPAALPPDVDWQLRYSDVLGEQTLRTVLEEWTPRSSAEHLASGWTGDRLSNFERGAARALVWELRMDRQRSAAAAHALRQGLHLSAMTSTASDERARPFVCRAHRDGGVVALFIHRPRLWLLSLMDETNDAGCPALAQWAEALHRVAIGG